MKVKKFFHVMGLVLAASWLIASSASATLPYTRTPPYIRTPDAQFRNLLDYDFSPNYTFTSDGLRMHYVDEGPEDGQVIMLMHGQPSWSYLYRKMIPILADAGYRVIAPDLVGFGKSDKPIRQDDITYVALVGWMQDFIDSLGLTDIVLFGQDWGGHIGLRLAAENTTRFDKIVIGNTNLSGGPGSENIPNVVRAVQRLWINYAQNVPNFDAGLLLDRGTRRSLNIRERNAYRVPFPRERYTAAARKLPSETDTDLEGDNAAWVVYQQWDIPFLTLCSDGDPVLGNACQRFINEVPGAVGQPHEIITNAGHFLQEDKGEEIATKILSWLSTF